MLKLSIVVPIYNVEKYLDKCIKSLLDQDFKNYEILLINDGSTDNSEELCLKYASKYKKKIKYFYKENGGLSSARNYGLERAVGEYVFFVDSDDYIVPNCLSKIIRKVDGKDILVFNYYNIYDDKKEVYETFDVNIKSPVNKYLISSPSACNKIFKISLFKENNITFPDKLFYEDLATVPALCCFTNKIVYDKAAYYCYLQRSGSIMHQKKYDSRVENIFKVLETLESRLSKDFKEKHHQEIEYIYIWHLLRNASLRFLDFDKKDMLLKVNNIIKAKFPKWNKNKYYMNYDIKRKIMCTLIMTKQYKLVQLLRRR